MDAEEERVLYLSRLGHEKIIKRGTYDVRDFRPITQDHPFYAYKTIAESEEYFKEVEKKKQEDMDDQSSQGEQFDVTSEPLTAEENLPDASDFSDSQSEVNASSENPDALADEILSSNFKVGMSQSEVDDFLKELLGG